MQTLIVGLLLAGVSAISIVAFKHPFGYAKLFPYLVAAITLTFAGIILWNIAVEVTWHNLSRLLNSPPLDEAKIAKQHIVLPYLWTVLAYLGFVMFLWANLKLPLFLQGAEENHASTGEQDEH